MAPPAPILPACADPVEPAFRPRGPRLFRYPATLGTILTLERRLYLPALGAICLLAAGLRVYKLADANPWWDEGFTYWLASQDLPGMLLRTAGDTHPPLSYFLYQLWMPLAGRSIFALRLLAVLFGVLAVPVCAGGARRLGGPAAGLAAGLLLAIAPFHVWWSQQIRMYALVALLCAASIFLLLRAVGCQLSGVRRQASGVRLLVALGLVNLAGLYTLYFFAVLLLLEGLFVAGCWLATRRRRLLAIAACLLLTPLPLLPWLAYFRQHAIRFPDSAEPPIGWLEFLQASWAELTLGIDSGVQAYTGLLVALGVLALALLIVLLFPSPAAAGEGQGEGTRGMAIWLALVAAGLPLAAYGVTLQRGLFFSAAYQTRYDLAALPALVILLAWGASRLPRPAALLPLALFVGTAAWSLPRLYDARHRTDDYQSLARFVEAYEQPGDAIVFDPDWNFHLFLLDYRGPLPWEAIPLRQPADAAYVDQVFTRWTAQYRALWLLQEAGGHDSGPQPPVRDWLQAHLHPSLQLAVGDRLLTLYVPAGAAPRTLNRGFQPRFKIGGAAGLSGFDLPVEDVRPGEVLHLTVYGEPPPAALFGAESIPGRPLPGAADFAIPIGGVTPAGRQPLRLQLAGGQTVTLGSVQVESHAAPPAADLPPLARPGGQTFGAQAMLTSYSMRPESPRPGEDLTVELQWRALEPFRQNYTVFVHLLDASNRVVAQRDSQPAGGRQPTIRWQPGQVLDDSYVLPIPTNLPPGRYQLELGMYLQSTGERLHLSGGQDRVLLEPITIS